MRKKIAFIIIAILYSSVKTTYSSIAQSAATLLPANLSVNPPQGKKRLVFVDANGGLYPLDSNTYASFKQLQDSATAMGLRTMSKSEAGDSINAMKATIAQKFSIPLGTVNQYIDGTGALRPFPNELDPLYQAEKSNYASIAALNNVAGSKVDTAKFTQDMAGKVSTGTYTSGLAGKVGTTTTVSLNGNPQPLSGNVSFTVDKASVGLGNVDNTSDLNKPISTATQTALNAKLSTESDPTVPAAVKSITSTDITKWNKVPLLYNSAGAVASTLKTWADIVTPTVASGYSINISTAGFSTILAVNVTAELNTSTPAAAPLVDIKTWTTSAVVVNILQSTSQTVVAGVNLNGLQFLQSLTGVKLHVTVFGY